MRDIEVKIVEDGLRRSERTRKRKVSYNEKVMQSTYNERPAKKPKTKHKRSEKDGVPAAVMPVVSKEMVKDLLDESLVSEEMTKSLLGESKISEEMDTSLLGESIVSGEMVKSLPGESTGEGGSLMGIGDQPREVDVRVSLEKSAHLKVKETLRAFNNHYLHFIQIPASTVSCGCKGSCVDPNICACAKLNNSDFPYVQRDGGRLVEAKAVVFECGPKCGCGPSCVNRTSQKGLRFRFEVFRTPKKGWGVRSWDYIPAGSPICEYIGVLKRSDEANSILDNMYIFDIDCLQTMKGLEGRERRLRDVSIPSEISSEKVDDSTEEFCIDVVSTGNFARFINHSCEPNLFIQCILSSHHDIKLARITLFAADSIPPLPELTYDYGYALDSVIVPDDKFKQLACYCGAAGCRKRLF